MMLTELVTILVYFCKFIHEIYLIINKLLIIGEIVEMMKYPLI